MSVGTYSFPPRDAAKRQYGTTNEMGIIKSTKALFAKSNAELMKLKTQSRSIDAKTSNAVPEGAKISSAKNLLILFIWT